MRAVLDSAAAPQQGLQTRTSWLCIADVCLSTLDEYLRLVYHLLDRKLWAQHAAAIAADPALQQAIVHVLMEHCLPAMAAPMHTDGPTGQQQASLDVQLLLRLSIALRHPSLRPAVTAAHRVLENAAAVGHAVSVFHKLLTSRPSTRPNSEFSMALQKAAGLLAACLHSILKPNQAALEQGGTALLALPAEVQAAMWQAAQLLPCLADSFTAEIDDTHAPFLDGSAVWNSRLNAFCYDLCQPMCLVFALHLRECGARQLSTWLEAVKASLRLLPRMPRLHGQLQPDSGTLTGAEDYCTRLIRYLVKRLPHRMRELQAQLQQWSGSMTGPASDEAAALDSLPTQLWALHTGLCRLIAALTAPASPLSLPGPPLAASGWLALGSSLNAVLLAAVDAIRLVQHTVEATRVEFLAETSR